MIKEPEYPPRIHHPILEGATPRRLKLTVEYDGTDFSGWQVQCGERAGEGEYGGENQPARTVQGVIERALRKITGLPIRIAGASRTDAGVHARAQVASLLLPGELPITNHQLCMALNSNMDKDVNAVSVEDVPLEFHAQRSAIGKIYTYSLFARRMRSAIYHRTHWHVRFKLDIEKMRQAAKYLVGTHDFTSFATMLRVIQAKRANEGRRELETVREIKRIEIIENPTRAELITIEVEGRGFLYQMVRTIAGTLVDVGRGHHPVEWVAEALAAKDRTKAGPTAPPQGLCLELVQY